MFFATTAIKEFWGKKKDNVILAGEWCRLYNDKKSLDLECLTYQWNNVEEVYKAQIYCSKVYKNTLIKLTNAFKFLPWNKFI